MSSLIRIVLLLLPLLAATRAHAGGLEYTGQGAQALGRGGATTARATDPMVLALNPAGLAELRGTQLMFNVNLAFLDACVDPIGYYGWGTYLGGNPSRLPHPETGEYQDIPLSGISGTEPNLVATANDYYFDPLDTVCLDQNVTPIPQLAWTMRVSEDLGIGFGFIFPSVQPSGKWGGKYGVITGDDGALRPAPTRYMMLSSANLGVFPNLGFGYRIFDELRIGASFEWGVVAVNNFTMAGAQGGTSPQNDIVAHVMAQDWFIPALTASIHIVPVDAIDIVLGFRWQDAVNAKGTLDTTTGIFDPAFEPYTTKGIEVQSVKQNMPWKLRGGIRYADRLTPRPTGTGSDESDFASGEVIHDALQDERWDIELDVEYQANSVNDQQEISYRENQAIFFKPIGMPLTSTTYPNPDDQVTEIEKHWQDQFSVRVGGSYNPLPGLLGLMAGAHWENRGVDPDYMQIDLWPVSRFGLHGGVTVRVGNAVDLTFSYAHIFQEDILVAPPAHRTGMEIDVARSTDPNKRAYNIDKASGAVLRRGPVGVNGQVVLEEPPLNGTPDGTAKLNQVLSRTASNQPPYIVNSGRYYSSYDILALGVNVHF
jgi:long-chain fatty acid transport protein